MKIRLAILETDQGYLNRIISVFNTKYSDKLEIYSFTELSAACSVLNSEKIDVFIANDSFEMNLSDIPKRCGFAYFVDLAGVDAVKGQKAICKFQKAELIYKQILSIYSEKAEDYLGIKQGGKGADCILFHSPGGGTGASSMAAACAIYFASKQKKVLYLNLETFGSADSFFTAEGRFDISDVIYALKTKKANLILKLESCVRQSPQGVNFYSKAKIALDMLELKSEEASRLIVELNASGLYDYIIIDGDFRIDRDYLQVYRQMQSVIWVSDGSEISNEKTRRAYQALSVMEKNLDVSLTGRIAFIYNKFSNKTGKTMEDIDVKNIGGAPKYEHLSSAQVIARLSVMDMFEKLMQQG